MMLRIYSRDERAQIYRELLQGYGGEAGAPIAFKFVDYFAGEGLMPLHRVDGEAVWRDGQFVVMVRKGLPIETELRTLAHELAHVLCGDVARREQTPQEIYNSNQMYAAWANRTARPESAQRVQAQESKADTRGAQILKEWERAGITA